MHSQEIGAHVPVLLNEVMRFLPDGSRRMFDLTFGLGGHSHAVLDAFPTLSVSACDRDIDSVNAYKNHYAKRLSLVHSTSDDFLKHMTETKATADFILADLGVSSIQLDRAERGFSFKHDGPLDMRMDRSRPLTAEIIVNTYPIRDLTVLLYTFGNERYASKIAANIVEHRKKSPLQTTGELSRIITAVKPKCRHYKLHPATKVFMALRIAVNKEPEHIRQTLNHIASSLSPGGRAVFISFHSLEDRLVKHSFRELSRVCKCSVQTPICNCGRIQTFRALTKKPLTATNREINENQRSRSAKMRILEKI